MFDKTSPVIQVTVRVWRVRVEQFNLARVNLILSFSEEDYKESIVMLRLISSCFR